MPRTRKIRPSGRKEARRISRRRKRSGKVPVSSWWKSHGRSKTSDIVAYLKEPIIVLRISLETDSRLRQYVEDALKAHDAAPSWKGTSIKHFIGFFDRWLFSDVNPRDPGFFIGEYSALTQTKSGKALHTYLPFHMWFLIFLESRHEYLDSPESTSNLPALVTWAPKHGEGFDTQMLPATRGGNAGPSEKGTPYQLRLVKRYKLMDKLINDVVEGCAMQCDAVATEWRDKEAKPGSNKEYMRMVGAEECAAAVREMKW